MNKSETLIILIPGFPVNEADTTCLPAQQLLIKAIQKIAPHIKVLVIAFQYPFTNVEYNWNNNTVIPLNGGNKSGVDRIKTWLNAWFKLKQLKKENNIIGIFSCWCGECALVGKYFAKTNNIKHFTWLCGQDAKASNKLVKYIKPSPGSLIAISDFLADEFQQNFHIRPAHIIPIGINTSMFNAPPVAKDIDILGAGSLIPLKQFNIFIEVVEALQKKIPSIKTMICGDGTEKEKLQQLIAEKNLQQHIFLTGEKPHTEVLELMQRSKLLLHPSSYEGFGAVCIEALYAGVHVISFCKPLYRQIQHWHIVADKNEMQQTAYMLLKNNPDYSPVLVSDINNSAVSILKLYGIT